MSVKKAEAALSQWARDVDVQVLQCRTGRHRFPYLNQSKITRPSELQGQFLVEADCENNCGTFIRKVYDRHGYIQRSYVGRYEYGPEYKLPAEVLEAKKDGEISQSYINAVCRVGLMGRAA
jgi:hypothetical protein